MPFVHRHHERCACASRGLARPFSLASTPRRFERDRPFTVRHISLDLVLDVPRKSVDGVATLDVVRVDATALEISLDAVGFTIKSVEVAIAKGDFQTVPHRYDGDTLTLALDADEALVRVAYRVTPRRGLYFLAPDEHVSERPQQVWSQCQDEDARCWIPCHDKPHQKCTTEMRVRVPVGWYALSNGQLVSQETTPDGEIFHWKMGKPHSSYLITLVAGEFAQLSGGDVDGVPLTYLVPKGREDDGARTFGETAAMVRHFAELTGVPFPWEKYAQAVVSDFIFGGMENTSATTMYEHILVDPRAALDISSEPLIAHELAHQWFGDLVTCRDWSHGWLNEGFATFFENLDRERRGGLDEYEYGILGDQEGYVSEASGRYRRAIVCQDYENPIELFDAHLYEKGELVLHMLRRELGDAVFWKGVHRYLERHAHGIVETRDLMRALEEVSGRSLERFFDQWVMKPGHPELEVRVEIDPALVVVHVTQTQKTTETALFQLDLEVDIVVEGEPARRELVKIDRARHTFAFRTSARATFVVIDPRHRIVCEMRTEAPAEALRAQLKSAPTARGRWLAAQALTRRDDPATILALANTVKDATAFWGTRVECADALGAIRSDDSLNALRDLLHVDHPKVRRAVVSSLGRFRRREAADALRPIALRDASYLVEGEAARALGATRQAVGFDTLVEILDRPSWSDVIRVGAADGLAALRDERAVPHLLSRVRYGVPMRARRAAIRSLARLTSDRRARETLEDLLEDRDPLVRSDVVSSLGEMNDSKSRGPLQRALDHETDGRVARRIRDVLRELGVSGARAEQQRLNDELETLKNELGELRARLSRIEAK